MTEPGTPRDNVPPARPPATANSGAVAVVGLDLDPDRVIPRKRVISWAMWDWATQPFNTVILTFVFTALYLIQDPFLDPVAAALPADDPIHQAALADLTTQLGAAVTIAGIAIALLAPVLGQRADAAGRRKLWLLIYTGGLVLCTGLLFFVQQGPEYFILGISLIAIGSVFSELAGVNYNATLVQVANKSTVGRVSGLGWGLGYIGGIVALVIVVMAYSADWFGLPTENGLPFRLVAAGCALWMVVFAIPFALFVPEAERAATAHKRPNFFASYVVLARDVAALFRQSRPTFWFLLASAVYRDGLAGVFTFGAVIATGVFGFEFLEVVIFGIAANLIAGVSTMLAGMFDDRIGPRAVIITALVGLIVSGMAVFFLHDAGTIVFWVFGLALTAFVGPAQSASRSLLARVTPAGREGEIFGLYATTGRAASFLAPGLWTVFLAVTGAIYWGIVGIVIVIALGLMLLLLVRIPALRQS